MMMDDDDVDFDNVQFVFIHDINAEANSLRATKDNSQRSGY